MLLQGRTAVVFGASGAIGGATARALAREGARLHLAGRTPETLERVARDIRAAGSAAETLEIDVLDERATIERMNELAAETGGIDIAINATSFMHDQGTELGGLSLARFMEGIDPFLAAQFNIAKATAPHMGGDRGGVILTVVAPAGPMAMPGHLGHIVCCAGTEAFTKALASELGPRNIRVLCLRSHAISDAIAAGSYTGRLFAPKAEAMGMAVEAWVAGAAQGTMLKRLPTLSQIAETIAFLASNHAAAMTATVVNVTAGLTID